MSVSQSTGNESVEPTEVRLSEKFNSPNSDIVYQSSDNVRFLVHSDNLRINATGFPLPSEHPTDTAILLPESATILGFIFQFCYPERHPDLMSLEFKDLAPIAEAVEKYEVFAAMNICNVRMKRTLPQHAAEIMAYAAKNNYPELLAKTLPLLLDEPLSNILPLLPFHLVIPWILQREAYSEVLKRALTHYHTTPGLGSPGPYCSSCGGYHEKGSGEQVLSNLQPGRGLSALLNLDAVFNIRCHRDGPEQTELATWRASIETDIRNVPVLVT